VTSLASRVEQLLGERIAERVAAVRVALARASTKWAFVRT